MWYKEFQFRNFKGIGSLRLPLSGPSTMLIGLNESGKTTILEAIFCFGYGGDDLGGINPGLASVRDPNNWIPIADRANFNGTISITAIVGLDEEDISSLKSHLRNRFNLVLTTKIPEEIRITETFHFKSSKYERTARTWSFTFRAKKVRGTKISEYGGQSSEWQSAIRFLALRLPRIWYFPDFLFELPDRFPLAAEAGADGEERDRNRFYQETFEQIISELGPGATIRTHLIDRLSSDERADRRNLEASLLQMGRTITDRLFGGWNRILGRVASMQEVVIDTFIEDGQPYLELKIKDADGYYDIAERSLGFRWFFTFLLLTSFRPSTPLTQRPLILLDEPASNLHSSAQVELLKSFARLTETAHLVYTTHSHHLIEVRWLNDAYVVKNSSVDAGDVQAYLDARVVSSASISATKYRKFANEHPHQTTYFQPVLDVLDYRISDLDLATEVVMVEGKSDFYLLKFASNQISDLQSLRFLPGTGAGSLDSAIRLHLAWAKPFLVIFDGDQEGIQQKARYLTTFGPILNGRLHLLPDLVGDPGVKELEDLLTEEDRRRLAANVSDAASPSKAKLHQAISELVATETRVDLSETAVDRLKALGAALNSLLTAIGTE